MKNPWETGDEFHGIRPAWCTACDRIEAVKTMSAKKLQACLDWPDTQQTVKKVILKRLAKLKGRAP